MIEGRQTGWLLAAHLALFFALGELNTFLSSYGIHLSLDVLLLVFPGLFLPVSGGFFMALFLGFLAAAAHPVPPALGLSGYLLLWMLLVWSRTRVRTHNKWHLGTICILLQLLWMLVLTALLLWPSREALGPALPGRLFLDALLSCISLAILVPLWCASQKRILVALGWNLDASPARS